MSGYKRMKKNEFIEQASQESAVLSLLANLNGLEVMEMTVKKGYEFIFYPSNDANQFEVFYITEGTVHDEFHDDHMHQGDLFHFQAITHPYHFHALTDVKMLYLTNEEFFSSMSDSIRNLSQILTDLNTKDTYTRTHSERVMKLSVLLAKAMPELKINIAELTIASLFHDIGKTHTPSEILLKPGTLTKEEYKIIQKHVTDSATMSRKIKMYTVDTIIIQHHERIDGSGYPNGLKDHEICNEAKIIAIADSYDAMTSDRPYRKALPKQIAVDDLKEQSGITYDAEMVQTFLSIINNQDI